MSRKGRKKRRQQGHRRAQTSAVPVESEQPQAKAPTLSVVETPAEAEPYRLPLAFGIEDFRSTASEAIPLIQAHGDELGLTEMPCPFRPALNLVAASCEAGLAVWFTARERETGALVGYALYALGAGQFFRTTLVASRQWIYLDPAYRRRGLLGLGYRFLEFCDAEMVRRGAGLIEQTAMLGTGFDRVLRRSGYEPVEELYWKHIER